MADPQVTRYSTEVLAAAPVSAQVTRQGSQVAFSRPGTNASALARVTRYATEVLAQFPARASVTRQGVQAAISRPGANAAALARVTRYGVEVLAGAPPKAAVTRQGSQVAFSRPGANSAATARVTRYGFEVLARSFIPITAFTVPANFELFLHNWAERSIMESSYSTDITASGEAVAEERTGLLQKPFRALTVQWAVKGDEEANDLLVEMRRLVDETSVVPIYPDAVELTQNASAGASTIYGDFSQGRFFKNGRVVIVRLRPTPTREGQTSVLGWEFGTINVRFDDRITITGTLSNALTAGRCLIVPLMKTHPHTSLRFRLATNNAIVLTATFDEVYGDTALPPLASDLPTGFDSYLGMPILSTVPQWAGDGVGMEFLREGSQDAVGLGRVVYQRGTRHRVVNELVFEEDRAGTWSLLRFFDSRRGRLMPFWLIDPENVFNVSGISGSFLSITPNGDLVDFQAESDYIGVVFSDGTAAVRQATVIQSVAGTWRITMDSALPAGYTAADVVGFGRARVCRFREDALAEEWQTTNVCSMNMPIIELLAEQEVTP